MNVKVLPRFIDLQQGTSEWLNFRKGKIGSSMAPSIMGVGFKTPLELFEDIMQDRDTEVTEAMKRGSLMEPIAREWINRRYGIELAPAVVQNRLYDWHISSLDGFYQDAGGNTFVCEIKCPGMRDHTTALDGHVPEKYLPQLYHILEDFPDLDKILYVSYRDDSQAEIWVQRSNPSLNYQFVEEAKFYTRLINCNPPEPTARDWMTTYDPILTEKAERYKDICRSIDSLESEKESLKRELIQPEYPRLQVGDLKIQKIIRSGSVEYSKIEALKEIDLNAYRKPPIESWRIG